MTKNSQNEPPHAHMMLAHTPTPDINVPYIVGELMGCARADKLRICVKVSLRHISANFYFDDFVDFRVFAKVLDYAGMSMETFIQLWPILNFDSPRASNELTNDVWYVGIGRWGACQQMGPRMRILTDFQ